MGRRGEEEKGMENVDPGSLPISASPRLSPTASTSRLPSPFPFFPFGNIASTDTFI